MANVKNFGLVGVGDNVQYGKAGSRIINNAGTFNFKAAAGGGDVAITTAGITSSAGNVTLTTGNVDLGAAAGTVSIGGDTTLSRHAAGIFQMNGTAAMVLPSGSAAQQPSPSATAGGLRYNTDGTTMEYSNGTTWVTLATGGTAVTAVSVVSANGLAGTSSGGTTPALTLSTTVTGILKGNGTAISAAVSGTDLKTVGGNTIIGSGDVGTIGPTYGGTGLATFGAGTVLYATAADTWGAAVPGATSGVQPYDAGLTALAAKTSTGIMVQTGADTYTSRSLVAPAAGFVISNADGVSGNPTFALANDLAAVEALSTVGYAVRTSNGQIMTTSGLVGGSGYTANLVAAGPYALNGGSGTGATATFNTSAGGVVTSITIVGTGSGYAASDVLTSTAFNSAQGGTLFAVTVASVDNETWTTRSFNGTAGRISVSNGNGVASNTDIDLVAVTDTGTGTFLKFDRDSYGRVTGTTSVVTSDITSLVNGQYLRLDGTNALTANMNAGGFRLTNLAEPSAAQDAATRNYVDNAITGLSWKQSVHTMSTTNVTISNPGTDTFGGHTITIGQRVLLAGQTASQDDGIYIFDTTSTPLVRSSDADTYNELNGAAVFVEQGTYQDSGWIQTATLTSFSSPQTWVQFSGAGAYTGGTGIDVTGNVISAKLGAGITSLPTNEIGIDVVSGKAVQLTGSATGDQLTFVLDGAGITSGLAQSGSGLKIAATGVTNAMLTNSSITVNGDTGSFSQALGGTLILSGDATQGVSSTATAGTVDFTVQDASYTGTKGVSAFTATEFVVTGGVVQIGVIGNSNLANSAITFTGTTGSDAVALGESMAIIGADSMITTTMGTNSLSIQLATVNVAHGGTGLTTLVANQLLFGNGTSPVSQDSDLTFVAATNTLTVGTATLTGTAGGPVTLAATATNSDIVLTPNGTGAVVIGPAGAGLIQSDAGMPLTVRGNTFLSLESVTGDTTMVLPASTTYKVTVSGPTAAQYATGLANEDLVNKQYVDTVAGSAAGDV